MISKQRLKKAYDEFLKSHELPPSVCFAPYINMDLDQGGGILPCFRSKTWAGNWKENGPIEDYNHPEFQKIRDDLFNGVWNSNCKGCANREQHNLHSIRYEFFKILKSNFNEQQIQSIVDHIKKDHKKYNIDHITGIEIRPHNNCNLECMHCNGFSSSKWQATTKKNLEVLTGPDEMNILFDFYHEGDSIDVAKWLNVNNPDALSDFFKQAKNLKDIHFTGGEPIMDKTHEKWLDIIPNKSEINLGYHSNLQHKLYNKLFDKWKQFKHVQIYNSWDACKRLYPYFRFHGEFSALTDNLEAIRLSFEGKKMLKLRGTLTVNFFSLFDFKDHLEMWSKFNMDPHHSFVEHTHPISLCWLPVELRDNLLVEARQYLEDPQYESIKSTVSIMLDDIEDFANQHRDHVDYIPPRTVRYINTLDKIRNTNIIEVCPELTKYFQGE